MRILLVEDDRALARGLVASLGAASMVVDTVESGEEALEYCRLYDFDMVLLASGLPDMEETPLDAGIWPQRLDHSGQRTVAIDDGVSRGRDTGDQRRPGRGLLPITPLPVNDLLPGVGDEDAPPVEIGAIEHDLVMDLPSR